MKSETATTGHKRLSSLAPVGALPLGILFALNLVDEFDRVAFATLAPEIRDAMSASDATIVTVASLATALAVMMALPLGYVADRTNRISITATAAVLWSFGAIATGLTGAVAIVAVARFSSGVGRLVNDSIGPSLLSDYYSPEALPFVSAVHRSASAIGTIIAGPIAGLVAATLGWRAAFFVAVIPTVLLLALIWRLKEPRADVRVTAPPASFWRSARELSRVRTLRRLWPIAFLYGGAFIPFVTSLLSLFLESVYGFDASQRGLVLAGYGVGGVLGLFLGSRLARRAFTNKQPGWLLQLTGTSILVFAAGLVLMTGTPSVLVGLLVVMLAIGTNAYLAPYTTLIALVTPSRLRSQGYSYSLFFFALGGLVFGRVAAVVAESSGMKAAFVLLAIPAALAGMGAMMSTPLVQGDALKEEADAHRG